MKIEIGDSVVHEDFGLGLVLEVYPNRNLYQVIFSKEKGIKKLIHGFYLEKSFKKVSIHE